MDILEQNGYKLKQLDYKDLDNLPLNKVQYTILKNRLPEEEDIIKYLYNDYDIFEDLDKLADITNAANLLLEHIKDKSKKILICSDLDCDGLTSATTLYRSLIDVFKVERDRVFVIINRRKDGNSFNPVLVSRVKEMWDKVKFDLMVISDQGSRNELQYQDFKKYTEDKMKIILTDHHHIEYEEYPYSVDCFINPQRVDSDYSRNVSGCTVAFLLMIKAYQLLTNSKDLSPFLPIFPFPAISVISDVMSCKEMVNRFIYKVGMRVINTYNNPNFVIYKKILEIPGIFTDNDIRMKLTSFINSANRMGIEDIGYSMLSTDDKEICYKSSIIVDDNNDLKKAEIKRITKEALEDLKDIPTDGGVVFKVSTDISVNGVIAARIGEIKKVPAICYIESDKEIISGSCRAIIKGFDLLECLAKINDENPGVIAQFGGHKDACGCSIYSDQFDLFKILFYKYSKEIISNLDVSSEIDLDMILPEDQITPDLVNSIRSLAPYGKDWNMPVFLSVFTLVSVIPMGGIARITFKRKSGGTISGFYNFSDNSGLTIDNIRQNLVRGGKYLVSYNLDITSYLKVYDFSLSIIKITPVKDTKC